MKEQPPFAQPKGKTIKKRGVPSAADWEALLAKEGLASEPGEDRGAAALRESLGVEEGGEGEGVVSEETIMQKLQEHFLHRPEHLGKHQGLHRVIAESVAHELGISADDVPEDLIDVAADETTRVGRRVQEIIDAHKDKPIRFHYDKLTALVERELGNEFPGFSPTVLQDIIEDTLERWRID